MNPNFENRLDEMRRKARESGRVDEAGHSVTGGPIPPHPATQQIRRPGYYGLPVLKKPVWSWQIPIYFFIGGASGMAAPIASAAMLTAELALARAAIWIALIGSILSPVLLAWDLGRPKRFIYMLRVYKWQSPMSVGSWIVTAFGLCVFPAFLVIEWLYQTGVGENSGSWTTAAISLATLSSLPGVLLATYTGALLAVTAVPVWFTHRILLPIHFGSAGLGSAAALLILAGFDFRALAAIGITAAIVETAIALWTWLRPQPTIDEPLHSGVSGLLLISAEILAGPLALALWLMNLTELGAGSFLLGAFLSRWGWIAAGQASANAPEALFATQEK